MSSVIDDCNAMVVVTVRLHCSETVERETRAQALGVEVSASKFEEWWSKPDRRVFTALLAGRQLAQTIYLITYEGRDVVKELRLKQTETVSARKRVVADNHFATKSSLMLRCSGCVVGVAVTR